MAVLLIMQMQDCLCEFYFKITSWFGKKNMEIIYRNSHFTLNTHLFTYEKNMEFTHAFHMQHALLLLKIIDVTGLFRIYNSRCIVQNA